MTANFDERSELAAAAQYRPPLVIVMDNQEYGTIRTHQERDYPGRSRHSAEEPNFAAMADAFGGCESASRKLADPSRNQRLPGH